MNNSQSEEYVPLGWIMAAQAWAWTVSCVGGIGNLVTICAIAYQLYLGRVWRRRHGPAGRPVVALEGDTILLLHLSICDFLYCVVNLPITAITYNYSLGRTELEPSKVFCTGAALFRYVNALAEWTTLGLLTVQRCVDLGRSRGARFFRPRPTLLFIAGIWVVSVVLQLGAITREHFSYDTDTFKCDMTHRTARLYFYALHSLLPCVLIMVGCGSIIWQVHANSRALHDAGISQEIVARRDRNLARSTALVLALLLLFLACVLPVCAFNLHTLLSPRPSLRLNIAIYMIYWVQYAVNFCVYAAVNPKFRRAYRELFLGSGWAGGSGGDIAVEGAVPGGGGGVASEITYKPSVTKLMLATPHLCVATSVALPVEEEEEEEEEEEDPKSNHVMRECPLPLLLPFLLRLPKGRRGCRYLRSCSYHGSRAAPLTTPSTPGRKISAPVMSSVHTLTYSSALLPHY